MAETAETFDRYWNSASVFGVEQIIRGKGNLSAFLTQATATENSDRARKLAVQLETSAVRFRDGAVQPEFTVVELVADDPAKGLGKASRDRLMVTQLGKIIGGVSRQLDLVSAYFVPGREGASF